MHVIFLDTQNDYVVLFNLQDESAAPTLSIASSNIAQTKKNLYYIFY